MIFYYVPPDPIDLTRVKPQGGTDWDVSLEETVKRDIVRQYLGEHAKWVCQSKDATRYTNDAPCLVYAYIFTVV